MARRKWTQEEIDFLKENYKKHSVPWCCENLERSYSQITHKAMRLGLLGKANYSNEEIQFLRDNLKKYGSEYCAEKLGRTKGGVIQVARRYKIDNGARWAKEDVLFLEKHAGWSDKRLATHLGKTIEAIYFKRTQMGIGKAIDHTLDLTISDAAMMLGVNPWLFRKRILKLGYKTRKLGKYRMISEKELKRFAKDNPEFYDATKCEKEYFIGCRWFEEKAKEDKQKMIDRRWGEWIKTS